VPKSTTFGIVTQAQNPSLLALCAVFIGIGVGCAQDAQIIKLKAFKPAIFTHYNSNNV
jgi:hypothetical protein